MTDGTPAGLARLLESTAAGLDGVEKHERGAGLEWSTGAIVFAAISGSRAEFRLSPPVAAAALRTPDTQKSARGSDWVVFAPAELDRHAIDRAEAWLASAWRRAGAES
jgi:hypothetical protein